MTYRIPAGFAVAVLLLAAACEETGSPSVGPGGASSWTALGEDGALVVSTQNTVLNGYSALAADAAAGTSTLVITSAGQLDLPAPMGPAGPGDLVLVIQMQGAVINTSNSPSFGAVTDFASAGRYELAVLGAVSGTSLQLALGCGGLRHDYSASGGSQVVRVPMFDSLTVDSFGSVVAMPWDGSRGGIAAVHVLNALVVDGAIDATGAGFRGGAVDSTTTGAALDNTTWRSTDPADGAQKGEGIAGFGASYDAAGGRYGRAAPANGGGGGTSHNGGGGGGANASNSLPWTGQGVMDAGATGASAWTLDPAYAANGNSLSNSSGGGRGGYTFSAANQDALVDPPGTASWGGNSRRERGGLGGRPFDDPPSERVYLGGGGGAGDSNNDAGGPGARGGGLVLLVARSVEGSGAIRADGLDGGNTVPGHTDAPGGGGAGGTIVVESLSTDGVTLSADGGNGGVQLITSNESEGPGGGGGGGRIAINTGVPTRSATGGANGTTTSQSLTEFPANGATRGADGVGTDTIELGDVQGCRPIDVQVTKDDARDSVARGARTTYVIQVSLVSDAAGVTGIVVQDPLPEGIASATWTCEATAGSSCADTSGTGAIDTTVDLASGGVATFVVDARLERNAPDVLENTVTVTAPGYVDGDPTNDVAVDVDDVRQEYGVAGSGCGCRTTAAGHAQGTSILVLAAGAMALFRRRRSS